MTTLTLAAPTSTAWIEQALAHLDLILIDHANCEKKAAGNALSLMFRYPTNTILANALSPLVREELLHFEKVQRHIERRQIRVKQLSAAPYASRLNQHIAKSDPEHLLDSLLVAAIIEARSHERLELLAMHCPDPDLSAFYQWLTEAEARHLVLYLNLALDHFPVAQVEPRLQDLLTSEAEILSTLYRKPRVHS